METMACPADPVKLEMVMYDVNIRQLRKLLTLLWLSLAVFELL